MEPSIEQNAEKIAEKFGYHGSLVLNTKQVINNKKVNDHHAIIPTANVYDVNYGELPSGEQKILALVSCRFLVGMGVPSFATVPGRSSLPTRWMNGSRTRATASRT